MKKAIKSDISHFVNFTISYVLYVFQVEFLENFVRQSESVYCARAKLLRIDLELLLNNQDHFYALLHHLKTTTDIYLLQFYKDISE